jgi:hypothetical protein
MAMRSDRSHDRRDLRPGAGAICGAGAVAIRASTCAVKSDGALAIVTGIRSRIWRSNASSSRWVFWDL